MHAHPTVWAPLQFEPVYKDYLWGGRTLARRYGRRLPPGAVAESWEISAHPDGMSRVAGGPWAGRTLADLAADCGANLLGRRARGGAFPLLVKLIDAADRLSVQVHPDDEAAARYGGEAKTEMWYVLGAEEEAGVFAGLAPGTGPERMRSAIQGGDFGDVLCRYAVRPGDAVYIPGGRVHAIDRGCFILEVQQSSNTTYRLYDWGRVGADGSPRELHVDQAVQVTRWDDAESPLVRPRVLPRSAGAGRRWLVHQSPYFRMERWDLDAPCREAARPETFQVLFAAEGGAVLEWAGGKTALPEGTSCLIPAALAGYGVVPQPRAALLHVTLPEPE